MAIMKNLSRNMKSMIDDGASFKDLVAALGKYDSELTLTIGDQLHFVKNILVNCLTDEISKSLLKKHKHDEF